VCNISSQASKKSEWHIGKVPTDSSATLATASGLFGSTPGYVTDGHPFFVNGVNERQVVRERGTIGYLTEPNFPPANTLNEPIKILLDVLPGLVTWNMMGLFSASSWVNSTITCRRISHEERQDMCIDNVDCSQHVRRTVVFLKSVHHFADGYWDLEARQCGFGSPDLFHQLRRVQGPIV